MPNGVKGKKSLSTPFPWISAGCAPGVRMRGPISAHPEIYLGVCGREIDRESVIERDYVSERQRQSVCVGKRKER